MDLKSQVEMEVGVFYLHHAMQQAFCILLAKVFTVGFGEDKNLG